MLDWIWITTSGTAVVMIVGTTVGIYAALLGLTRLAGLRSFSKLSSFDFAITVAFGSVVATVVLSENPPLLQGIAALAALYGIQTLVSVLRNHSSLVRQTVDNQPLLLMAGSDVLPQNLRKARMTKDDLWAKLREANVLRLDQVRAVVMESTGDVSVLHAKPDGPDLERGLLDGVRGTEALRVDNVQGGA